MTEQGGVVTERDDDEVPTTIKQCGDDREGER